MAGLEGTAALPSYSAGVTGFGGGGAAGAAVHGTFGSLNAGNLFIIAGVTPSVIAGAMSTTDKFELKPVIGGGAQLYLSSPILDLLAARPLAVTAGAEMTTAGPRFNVMAQVGVWTSNDLRKGLTLGAGYQNLGGKDQFCASLSFVGIPF